MSKPLNRFGTNGPSANIMQPGLMLSFKDMWDPEWDYGEPPPHRDPWIDPENCCAEDGLDFSDDDQVDQEQEYELTSESPMHISHHSYSATTDYTEDMSVNDRPQSEDLHPLEQASAYTMHLLSNNDLRWKEYRNNRGLQTKRRQRRLPWKCGHSCRQTIRRITK